MTLSTNIYVLDPVDVLELFRFAQGLLAKYDDRSGWSDSGRQEWTDQDRCSIWGEPGTRTIANRIGQGLPAILEIAYRPEAPLRTAEQAAACSADCDDPCDGDHYRRACWADIDLDTAYGYRDIRSWGCGDLHAVLVAEIGNWLDERGVRWEWRNEFTGETHGGEDRYERLIDLASSGFEASAWMRTSVLPAISANLIA